MKDWSEAFAKRVEQILESIITESSSDDEIRSAIEDNIDIGDLIKEVVEEDATQDKIKAKLRELIIKEIERAENIGNLSQDDDCISDAISNLDFGEMIEELLDNDDEVKQKLRLKLQELTIARIGEMDDEDLPEQQDFVEILNLDEVINKVFEEDQGVKDALFKEVKSLIVEYIENKLDESDLPDDLISRISVDEAVKKIIESGVLKQILEKAIRNVMQSQIEEQLKSGKLSDVFWSLLPVDEIKKVVESASFREEFDERLQGAIGDILPYAISTDNPMFISQVFANPVLTNAMSNVVYNVLQSPKAAAKLHDVVKSMIKNQGAMRKYFPAVILDQIKSIFGIK